MEFLLGLFLGSILRPTLKTVWGLISNFSSKILLGFYYDIQQSYPDFINVTLDIISFDENGVMHHDIDSLVRDVPIGTVYLNPFMNFLFRRSHLTTTPEKPLPDLYPIRPRPKWQKKLAHSKEATRLRQRIAQTTRPPWLDKILCLGPHSLASQRAKRARGWGRMLSKVVGLAGQFTTNQAAMDMASGLPHRKVEFAVFVTYERGIPERDQHFRAIAIRKDIFLSLWNAETQSATTQMPVFGNPHLAQRWQTLITASRECQRHPYKYAVMHHYVPQERWNLWHPHLKEDRQAGLPAHTPRLLEYQPGAPS